MLTQILRRKAKGVVNSLSNIAANLATAIGTPGVSLIQVK